MQEQLSAPGGAPIQGIPRCRRCGDVIGVYEPMVVIEGDRPRVASRAAEPNGHVIGGERYHRACFARAHEDERRS